MQINILLNKHYEIQQNQLDATITIYWSPRSAQHVLGNISPIKQLPSYRTHSAMLPLSKPLPTTTTGHYTICCKNPSLMLLKMGKIDQNRLSWSWRSINCYCCVQLVFMYYFAYNDDAWSNTNQFYYETQMYGNKQTETATQFLHNN